jgi:3-dehydroquinate synthase
VVERVEVPVRAPYPVLVGVDLDLGGILSGTLEPGVAAILTDSNVGPEHGARVSRSLQEAGWRVAEVLEVPAGEVSKGLATYAQVVRGLARAGISRDGTLFALGGGVVGDLGGFVAGTYMRGIDLVMLPTTLLAMVDSSVGGKVGVDLPEGKNLIGCFVRPRLVVAHLHWLETLPQREISHGLAEAIKMGLLSGGEFFEDLGRIGAARTGSLDALKTLVVHSIRFKGDVVAEDELESGRRAILNYGHTVGHGLEAAAGYGLPHGEAISAGMLAAARLSRERFGTDLVPLHEDLLRAAALPHKAPALSTEKILAAMARDKKRLSHDGAHRFVLLEDVGEPKWGVPVGEEDARRAIEAVVG